MQRAVHRCSAGLARALVALGLAASCAGCMMPGPLGSATRPNVFILRGTVGYFPCITQLEDRLLDEGVCPTVAFPDAYRKVAERIIAGRNTGRFESPLVIAGYSNGADRAIDVACLLNERGITVDKLVLLESSGAKSIPCNVRECFNIYKYQVWGEIIPIFRGMPVRPEGPATTVVNYNLRDYNDGRFDWYNHLTVSANPYVQELMVDEVMTAIDPGPSSDDQSAGDGTSERVTYPSHGDPPPPDP
jgi:hypothetical protein